MNKDNNTYICNLERYSIILPGTIWDEKVRWLLMSAQNFCKEVEAANKAQTTADKANASCNVM